MTLALLAHAVNVHFSSVHCDSHAAFLYTRPCGHDVGSKLFYRLFCRNLSKEGNVVLCPNYRLWPEADLCGMMSDMELFVSWLGEEAQMKQYHIDKEAVYFMGHSSGAHLISYYALTHLPPPPSPSPPPPLPPLLYLLAVIFVWQHHLIWISIDNSNKHVVCIIYRH